MNPEQPPQRSNVDDLQEVFFDPTDGRYKTVGQTDSSCPTWIDLPTLFNLEEKEEYDL